MHISFNVAGTKLAECVVSHKNQELLFQASTYNRIEDKEYGGMFDEINDYFKRLPENRQDAIWNVYLNLRQLLDNPGDFNRLHTDVQALIVDLYNQIQLDEIRSWLVYHGQGVVLPANLKENYEDNDIIPLTYLRKDYIGLVALSIVLRPMVPVWSEYTGIVQSQVGTVFKEYRAMSLLARTPLISTPEFERLRTYVAASIERETVSLSAVLGGLGEAEYPDWMLAQVIVRRVAIVKISRPDGSANIISTVYKYIEVNTKTDRKFGGMVREKHGRYLHGENDNLSLPENYKIKQEVSEATIIGISSYTEDLLKMATDIQRDISLKLVTDCYETLCRQKSFDRQPFQMTLTQWIVAPVFSPRSVPYQDYATMLRTVAVTQAILFHRGHRVLAALMTAQPVPKDADMLFESRAKIPRDLQEQLLQLYPHSLKMNMRISDNVAIQAIEIIVNGVTASDWHISVPKLLAVDILPTAGITQIPAPADIRVLLARLVLSLNQQPSE